jgi:putative flippase GtrA
VSVRVRWLRFNLVGIMGFALQTTTLWLLMRWADVPVAAAVTIGVLAAVSHNFLWHECFTWPGRPQARRFERWLSFHLSTGLISVVTNVGVTTLVMTMTGLPIVPANAIAVLAASAVNFWINDRVIFRPRSVSVS